MNKILTILTTLLISTLSYGQTTGVFGSNKYLNGVEQGNYSGTTNKWIKLAELTLNGNYNGAGIAIDFFPKNANHGDSRQQLNVQFRNTGGTGIYQSTYDISLIHFSGQHATIKDVKVIHTSGTLVSNNKLSVWVQMGISWLYSIPIEVRTYGKVTFKTTNQPTWTNITDTGTVYDLQSYYGMIGKRFDVRGTIRAEEINIETDWADFVFEEDYDLMPLEHVNEYIQSNGHLPDVPSADMVEEEGVNLGEMNAILLRKIEELTLHMIEMKQENDTQQKAINALLKSQVESLEK